MNAINPAVLRLARQHECSIGAAHALWMAGPDRQAQAPDDLDDYCSTCNGSGEGMHDGSSCRACGGSGAACLPRHYYDND